MLIPSLLLLLSLPSALGNPQGGPRDFRVETTATGRTTLALGLKGAPSFLLGSSGDAWNTAPAAGFVIEVPFSEFASVAGGFTHSLHRMQDSAGLLGEDEQGARPPAIDAAVFGGVQRHLTMDLGIRLGIPVTSETSWQPRRSVFFPWFRMGLAGVRTHTVLDLPTFTGRERHHTRRWHLAPLLDAGLTWRLPGRVSLAPHLQAISFFGLDRNELTGRDHLGVTWRLEPSLDVLLHF